MAIGQPVDQFEMAGAIVDPEAVRREKIVAHVKIRRAIAIDIMKLRGQSPVIRNGHGIALGITPPPWFIRHFAKMSVPVVQIERSGHPSLVGGVGGLAGRSDGLNQEAGLKFVGWNGTLLQLLQAGPGQLSVLRDGH